MTIAGYIDRLCPQCATSTQHRILKPQKQWQCLICDTVTEAHSRPVRRRSTAFAADRKGQRHSYLIDWIPPDLFQAAKARADRDAISLRSVLLTYLQTWAAE